MPRLAMRDRLRADARLGEEISHDIKVRLHHLLMRGRTGQTHHAHRGIDIRRL